MRDGTRLTHCRAQTMEAKKQNGAKQQHCNVAETMGRRSNNKQSSFSLNVEALVPNHITVPFSEETNRAAPFILLLQVHRSRLLWRELQPCLFDSKKTIARKLVRGIVESVDLKRIIRQEHRKERTESVLRPDKEQPKNGKTKNNDCSSSLTIRRRRLRVEGTDTKNLKKLLIWIQPTPTTPLEYFFGGLLVKWEHERIQAESLAGYIATLGGGFFMCHHWMTAVRLAQQQQRLAAYLGDTEMFYKCLINQAYNHIYAGRFRIANRLIKYVMQAVKQGSHGDDVLIKMCYSARLFGKRVRRAAIKDNKLSHSTVDDFARIRLVQDQSRDADLIKPFSS